MRKAIIRYLFSEYGLSPAGRSADRSRRGARTERPPWCWNEAPRRPRHEGVAKGSSPAISTLDSGARVWTDPVSWFWSFKRSARLIGETILMAYVGTLTGGIAAFCLNFVA